MITGSMVDPPYRINSSRRKWRRWFRVVVHSPGSHAIAQCDRLESFVILKTMPILTAHHQTNQPLMLLKQLCRLAINLFRWVVIAALQIFTLLLYTRYSSPAEPDVANYLYDSLSPRDKREAQRYSKRVSLGCYWKMLPFDVWNSGKKIV